MRRSIPTATARLLTVAAMAVAFAVSASARAQTASVDPAATQILQQVTEYLGNLQQFSVDTQNTVEAVLESGQKIHFDLANSLTVQRPNKLRAERHGDIIDQSWYYDGKTVTLYNASDGYYASLTAPGTIEEMLDFARESLGVIAPASDLLYRNAFPLLTQNLDSAAIIGKAVIGGVVCNHLAFSRSDVDFQVWVPETGDPLPRKYVVTAKESFAHPDTVVVMSNWNLTPKLTDDVFNFVPSQDASPTEFLRLDSNSASAQ